LAEPHLSAHLIFAGDLPRAELASALAAADIAICNTSNVALILTDHYLRPELPGILAGQELLGKTSILLAKPAGPELWLGPHFTTSPAETFAELVYWLRAHPSSFAPPSRSAESIGLAAEWIASALREIASGSPQELDRHLWTRDVRTGSMEAHAFRRPRFIPGEWISPRTGIVRRIVHETEAFGRHHVAVEYALGPLPEGIYRQKTRGLAYGSSGHTRQEARDKAVYEAVERFCSHYSGRERFAVHKYDPGTCVHPNELMRLSDGQLRREELDAFDEDREIAWRWADALDGSYPGRWIPAAMALLDYADESQPNFALSTSSGCAAGPDRQFAVQAAVRELVERDAVALWWYRQALRPTVTSVVPPPLMLDPGGRTLEVLDITTEFGIAVCVAVSSCLDGSDPVFGAGSGADLETASQDALRELAQVLTWRTFWRDTKPFGHGSTHAFLRGQDVPGRVLPDVAGLPPMYVVDLSRPDVGLSVVRVVAPQLLSHRLGLRHARLWEAPVQLGWQCTTGMKDLRDDATPCPI
jgi:ribosomal protein S12 methylthiotransferase accessory factor